MAAASIAVSVQAGSFMPLRGLMKPLNNSKVSILGGRVHGFGLSPLLTVLTQPRKDLKVSIAWCIAHRTVRTALTAVLVEPLDNLKVSTACSIVHGRGRAVFCSVSVESHEHCKVSTLGGQVHRGGLAWSHKTTSKCPAPGAASISSIWWSPVDDSREKSHLTMSRDSLWAAMSFPKNTSSGYCLTSRHLRFSNGHSG